MADPGLIFAVSEPGPDVSETEFTDWYDNEHAPARLKVPGFTNAIRYKTTDAQTPSWIATFEIASTSVAHSEPYKILALLASERERALVPRLALLNRRVYELLTVRSRPGLSSSDLPAKYLFVITVLVPPELEEEFNKWYEEEHIPNIMKTPGWQRCRRYKLESSVELARGPVATPEHPVHNYLTLHEWNRDGYAASPELHAAISTPWAQKMQKEVKASSLRFFVLYKNKAIAV